MVLRINLLFHVIGKTDNGLNKWLVGKLNAYTIIY